VGPTGETIIDYSIYDAMRAGFGKLVFVIRKDIEHNSAKSSATRFEKRIAVEYAYQELDKLPAPYTLPAGRTKPWGTTHAISWPNASCKDKFRPPSTPDDFYRRQAYKVLAEHLTSGTPDYAMVGFSSRTPCPDSADVTPTMPSNQLRPVPLNAAFRPWVQLRQDVLQTRSYASPVPELRLPTGGEQGNDIMRKPEPMQQGIVPRRSFSGELQFPGPDLCAERPGTTTETG